MTEEVQVGNKTIDVTRLGAVQFMDILAGVSRKQYLNEAKALAEDIAKPRVRVDFLNQALKDAMRINEESINSAATEEGQVALLSTLLRHQE